VRWFWSERSLYGSAFVLVRLMLCFGLWKLRS
jgi:hypothetical protein